MSLLEGLFDWLGDFWGMVVVIVIGLFLLPGCAMTERYDRDYRQQDRINRETVEHLSQHKERLKVVERRIRALEEMNGDLHDWNGYKAP